MNARLMICVLLLGNSIYGMDNPQNQKKDNAQQHGSPILTLKKIHDFLTSSSAAMMCPNSEALASNLHEARIAADNKPQPTQKKVEIDPSTSPVMYAMSLAFHIQK